jgi:hypothetical protein
MVTALLAWIEPVNEPAPAPETAGLGPGLGRGAHAN